MVTFQVKMIVIEMTMEEIEMLLNICPSNFALLFQNSVELE